MTSPARIIAGDAADMAAIADGAARLVVTSPPFFELSAEEMLRLPIDRQNQPLFLERKLFGLVDDLAPAFREIARILGRKGMLALHTKDIAYGGLLLPLAARHEALAAACGFRAVTRIRWIPTDRPRRSGRRAARAPRLGDWRAPESEVFVVMRHLEAPRRPARPPVAGLENSDFLAEPVWRTPGETHRPRHRHAGPPEVFRRLLALYSRPGDLVVDPFCGGGGVLAVAQAMGRDAIGYDIDPGAVALARRRLEP
jgi:site-specific DNA-methyltransferase (adenine-specific)